MTQSPFAAATYSLDEANVLLGRSKRAILGYRQVSGTCKKMAIGVHRSPVEIESRRDVNLGVVSFLVSKERGISAPGLKHS